MFKKALFTVILSLIFIPAVQSQNAAEPHPHKPALKQEGIDHPRGKNQPHPGVAKENASHSMPKADIVDIKHQRKEHMRMDHPPSPEPKRKPHDGPGHAAEKRAEHMQKFRENHPDAGKAVEHKEERLADFMARHPDFSEEEAKQLMIFKHKHPDIPDQLLREKWRRHHKPRPADMPPVPENEYQGEGLNPHPRKVNKMKELNENRPGVKAEHKREAIEHRREMKKARDFKKDHLQERKEHLRKGAEHRQDVKKAHKIHEKHPGATKGQVKAALNPPRAVDKQDHKN